MTDGKVVSVYGAVTSAVTDFDSSALFSNGTPYLKEIIIFFKEEPLLINLLP